jgi:hypothetical protein
MRKFENHIIFTLTLFYNDHPHSLTGDAHWTLTVCSRYTHSQEKVLCLFLTFQNPTGYVMQQQV